MFLRIQKLRQQDQQEKDDPGSVRAPVGPSERHLMASPSRAQAAPAEQAPVDLDASSAIASRVRPQGQVVSPGSVRHAASVSPKDSAPGDALNSVNAANAKTDEFGALPVSAQAGVLLGQYRRSRVEFGMARMRMGAYLHIIRANKLWEGVAENFDAFIAAENINPHAARQYMNVAKTFIFDMGLPEETLSKLSIAGISALEKAGKVIGEDNREEIVEILASLSERDAIQRLMELSTDEQLGPNKPGLRVLRLLREFYEMPPDLQSEFLGKVSVKRKREDDTPAESPKNSNPSLGMRRPR